MIVHCSLKFLPNARRASHFASLRVTKIMCRHFARLLPLLRYDFLVLTTELCDFELGESFFLGLFGSLSLYAGNNI